MTPQEHEQLIAQMAAQPGAEHEFVVGRTMEAQDRDGLSAGISPQAMDALNRSMITWVGTRMMRFNDERGVMPQNVRVVMSVELEV